MKKIAMFGGSFNPVHIGHTGLVARMIETFSLDKVYVMPTFSTPLKDNTPMLSAHHRFNMCKLAFEEFNNVVVSDIEICRKGKSYTADTIDTLLQENSGSEFYLIVGADSFMQLPLWYRAKDIFSSATLLTVARDELNAESLFIRKFEYENEYKATIHIVNEPIAQISSTQIRNAIKNREEYKHLLPLKVSDYIIKNDLYNYDD